MSKKQFYIFEDNIRGNFGEVDKPLNNTEIVNLLNEQQASIQSLKGENEQLKYDNFMFKGVIETFQKVAISERKKLEKENEQLKKQLSKYYKPIISIFNKDKGDWKWNDNNDIILNIRNGKSFYLRNSGAVENLVDLLNEQQATINELQAKLREKEEDEKLYANEILELRETNKEHIKFKSLGGDY